MPDLRDSLSRVRSMQERHAGWGIAVTCLVIAVVGFATLNPYYLHVVILSALMVVFSISIRPLLVAGEASFCHGAFYAIGAYTVGILSVDHGWSVWLALPAAGVVAGIAAVFIGVPSLRTTGSYFFLITFCFLVVANSVFQYATGLTGGHGGIPGIPKPEGLETIDQLYVLAVVVAGLVAILFLRFDRSRWGLELRALGDSKEMAQAAGISRLGNMVGAFTVGAVFAGVAGGIYASYVSFISPSSFTMWLSIYALIYVVVGGVKYHSGAIAGAVVLTVLPVAVSWSEIYVAVFSAAITLVILMLLPNGVVTELVDRLAPRRDRQAASSPEQPPAAPGGTAVMAEAAGEQRPPAPVSVPAQGTRAELILEVRDLRIHFGGVKAVDGVSLEVRSGETVGIIGPNGAGKTTLFNGISGFVRPTGGDVHFGGESVVGVSPHRIVSRGLTRTFQSATVFEHLTVFENVLVACHGDAASVGRFLTPIHREAGTRERVMEILDTFGLADWAGTEARNVPYGLGRRLGMAIALATGPKLLCLDEPMAGLSDTEARAMVEVIRDLTARHDLSLLIIEHRVSVMRDLCERLVAINFGQVIASGETQAVLSSPEVIESYLGQEQGETVDV